MKNLFSKNANIQKFVDRYAISLEEDGMPRTAARITALFTVHPGVLSFSELAQQLQVSRGTISTNTRLLERMGIIERVSIPGDRQDHFQATENPALRTIEYWAGRQLKNEKLAEELLADKNISRDTKKRVKELLAFFKASTSSAREMLADLRKTKM